MNFFCFLNFHKIINHCAVCIFSKTNKDKSTEIFPSLILRTSDKCVLTMQKAQKVHKGLQF